jgi:hypothetical protein
MTAHHQKMTSTIEIGGTSVPVLNGVPLMLMTEVELIAVMQFEGSKNAFRAWCRKIGIKSVSGRRGVFDPKLVRHCLDAAQGISQSIAANAEHPPLSLVEQRRARRGQA